MMMEVEDEEEKYTRDFPTGCGISGLPFKIFNGKKPLYYCTRDFPTLCGPNAPSTWRRDVGAVRSKPLMGAEEVSRSFQNMNGMGKRKGLEPDLSNFGVGRSKERENEVDLKEGQKLKGKGLGLNSVNEMRSKERERMVDLKRNEKLKGREVGLKNCGEREKVVEMLRLFRERCSELSGRGIRRVDTTAYGELKNEGKIVNRSALKIGDVPGVEVGDKFHYRIELCMVGLHKQTQGGIDTMEWRDGRVATSIVANERHLDKMNDPNALTYIGEGGNLKRNEVGVPPDQELKGGNRALWTSMKENRPVRLIRGLVSDKSIARKLYVYDGLYEVRECVKKKGPQGNMIFEFQLSRCAGQPAVPWQECRQYLI